MKIEKTVRIAERNDLMPVVCRETGINSALMVPRIPHSIRGGFVFDYVHPLAYWSNAEGMVRAGRAYLESVKNNNVLSGLVLMSYKRLELIDQGLLSSTEANAVLSTAHENVLIDLLVLVARLTDKNTTGCSQLMLEYKDIKDLKDMTGALTSYCKTIQDQVFGDSDDEVQDRIKILNQELRAERRVAGGSAVYVSARDTAKRLEQEHAVNVRNAKQLIKDNTIVLHAEGLLGPKLHEFLSKTLLSGDNVSILGSETKNKLVLKLEALAHPSAALIVKALQDAADPRNIFGRTTEEALDRAVEKTGTKRLSIAEMIAKKREEEKQRSEGSALSANAGTEF